MGSSVKSSVKHPLYARSVKKHKGRPVNMATQLNSYVLTAPLSQRYAIVPNSVAGEGCLFYQSSGPNQHTPLRSGGESKSPDLLPSPTPTFGATTYERPSEDLRMRPSPSLDSRDNLPPYDDVQVSPVYPVQSDIRLYEGRDPRNNRLMTPPDRKIPSTSILHEHSVERQFLELQSRGRGHPSHLPGPGARTTGYQLHYTSPPNPGPVQAALTTAGVDVGRAFYSGVNSNFGNGSSTYPNNVSVPAVNTTVSSTFHAIYTQLA